MSFTPNAPLVAGDKIESAKNLAHYHPDDINLPNTDISPPTFTAEYQYNLERKAVKFW